MSFFKKKPSHVSNIEYSDSREKANLWVTPTIISVVSIAVLSGLFLAGYGWAKAPCIVAMLVLFKSMTVIKNHRQILSKYYEQSSIKEIEKAAKEDSDSDYDY